MRFWRQWTEVVFSVGVGEAAWAAVVATGDSCQLLDAGGARRGGEGDEWDADFRGFGGWTRMGGKRWPSRLALLSALFS